MQTDVERSFEDDKQPVGTGGTLCSYGLKCNRIVQLSNSLRN